MTVDNETKGSLPRHVAIIMDGNGRWALERGKARIEGHTQGARTVRDIVTYARELGIRHLTLFAFSSENWGRPPDEVHGLMDLLYEYLVEERPTLIKNGIELSTIGVLERLPRPVQALIESVKAATLGNDGMRLTLALSYGSRDEIVRGMKKMARALDRGEIVADEIDENAIGTFLDTGEMPDPDLMIRTSGEQRISNFMLWQLAYAELYFTPVPWPAFTRAEFDLALRAYRTRQRRFGLTGQQVSDEVGLPLGAADADEPASGKKSADDDAGRPQGSDASGRAR
jgi:undecaprenyl diphosphate synthase